MSMLRIDHEGLTEDGAMKLWAVSHIDFSENNLVTVFVWADDWKTALRQHPAYFNPVSQKGWDDWFAGMPKTLEDTKDYAFDTDSIIEVVEVPK